jgi:hypothetical protein
VARLGAVVLACFTLTACAGNPLSIFPQGTAETLQITLGYDEPLQGLEVSCHEDSEGWQSRWRIEGNGLLQQVTYGQAPRGFREMRVAEPLRTGRVCKVIVYFRDAKQRPIAEWVHFLSEDPVITCDSLDACYREMLLGVIHTSYIYVP